VINKDRRDASSVFTGVGAVIALAVGATKTTTVYDAPAK
jgi:hypothetical protein